MQQSNSSSNITKLIKTMSKLPDISQKTIKRITFMLLKNKILMRELIQALTICEESVIECVKCRMYTENKELCYICSSDTRNKRYLCIVSDMINLIAIERSQSFKGVYYVLHGMISHLNNIGPEELQLERLIDFIKQENIEEVLIGLSPNTQGQTTSYLLQNLLQDIVNVRTLNIGVSLGADLEYVDANTIAHAIPK